MDNRIPETSFTSAENGHKIAFDPRDLSETEERSKQPKLTLMEDVLLLGLKDKQVSVSEDGPTRTPQITDLPVFAIGLPVLLEREHLLCPTRVHCH